MNLVPPRFVSGMSERSWGSTPGVDANAPTVADSRLCQSRLSRSKMSPNKCACRS